MQSLHDLSHLKITFQKAVLHINGGENNAYQLLGTPGYGFSNENLLEGSLQGLSVTAAGQFHYSVAILGALCHQL